LAKAAKKRNKKKSKEQEREKRIADEQKDVVSMRDMELEAINQKLTNESLKIKEVRLCIVQCACSSKFISC
jgi:hypothetical protein